MTFDPLLPTLPLPDVVLQYAPYLDAEISPDDAMYAGNRHHYLSCGASALACILHAIGLSEMEKPSRLLDFGCGAGRVTRWLRAAFPGALIHGCDIRKQDLEFVGQRFRATTWVSGVDIGALAAPDSYDLIWVGSVFTHLSAEASTRMFDRLMGWLTPKGLLVFSVHGRFVLQRPRPGDNTYGLGDSWGGVVERYEATGFGYADYSQQDGYGISLSKSAWWIDLIESRTETRLTSLTERAWDKHHDVIAVQRTNWN